MPRSDKPERRRFDRDKNFKIWSKEERETYEERRTALAPFIRDIMTPAPTAKKKDIFSDLFGPSEK